MVTSTSAELASRSPPCPPLKRPRRFWLTFGKLELADGCLKAAVNALNLGSAARMTQKVAAIWPMALTVFAKSV
jgi:hypothetical protein